MQLLEGCSKFPAILLLLLCKYDRLKKRIASYGGSAGAGTSLWLAFHDDLADPKSKEPLLRSTKGCRQEKFFFKYLKVSQRVSLSRLWPRTRRL
jgi:hypothetical protein